MKILVAGDYCPQDRVLPLLKDCNYDALLGDIRKITSCADISIVNLECPVVEGSERPIAKCGPNLSCGINGIDALRWAGFDCVTLANNHFFDYGEDGVESTLQTCKDKGLLSVGGGRNLSEASQVCYIKSGNATLALINCCEHEFSIATEQTGGSNPLNPISQYYAIEEAKVKADYVLVIVHGGKEHYQLPSPRMCQTYRFFVDAGADAVVNHHQHCFSGYEIYKDRPIIYGLGNFCFDNPHFRGDKWNFGYFVQFDTDNLSCPQLIPYRQCDEEPSVRLINYVAFEKEIIALNNIIGNHEELNLKYQSFLKSKRRHYRTFLAPYSNHYIRALFNKGFLPSFLSDKRKLALYDFIVCESHVDFILDVLKH